MFKKLSFWVVMISMFSVNAFAYEDGPMPLHSVDQTKGHGLQSGQGSQLQGTTMRLQDVLGDGAISKGSGLDVYNKTPYEITFDLNGTPFSGKSMTNSYGSLSVTWKLIEFQCMRKVKCPAVIKWKTPGKETVISTTVNTQTGSIGEDNGLYVNLPSLNSALEKANVPLKVMLSNENGAVSGHADRNGYELITVLPK